jgi:hypothetical protein
MNKTGAKSKQNEKLSILKKRLADVLTDLCEISYDCTEKEFNRLFSMLGGNDVPSLTPTNIIRYFNPTLKKFKMPKDPAYQIQKMGEVLAEGFDFQKALEDFKPYQKGSKGGLKKYKKEIITERDERVEILKLYLKLKNTQILKRHRKEVFSLYKNIIPEDIEKKLKLHGAKMLAIEWMAAEWGCSKHTIQQIIYRNS